jgi:hypothetical protein
MSSASATRVDCSWSAGKPSRDYDWLVFSKRTRVKRRHEAVDLRQREPGHPFDEVFQKEDKRIRRRHGWGAVVEAVFTILDMLPW